MTNVFVDACLDLVYAYGWPSRLVRPIWKVKRAPKRAYPSFRRFSCAIAHHFLGDPDSMSKMPNFFVDVRQDLFYAYGWPSQLVRPIWKVKRAPKRAYPSFLGFSCAMAHYFLGDLRRQKCQFFLWTSVKTLSMHTVGHHGLYDPFGRSNEPRSEYTPYFDDFRVL